MCYEEGVEIFSKDEGDADLNPTHDLGGFSIIEAQSVRATDKGVERVLSYLENKTGGERYARRKDINPVELKDILPEVCFFEPIYDDKGFVKDAVIRLQGTKAASFYGDFTNQSVLNHPSSEVSNRIVAAIAAAIEGKCPVLSEANALSRSRDYLTVKALYVPLAEDGENIDKLFGYIRVFRRDFSVELS